jgi:hypothetical protein
MARGMRRWLKTSGANRHDAAREKMERIYAQRGIMSDPKFEIQYTRVTSASRPVCAATK